MKQNLDQLADFLEKTRIPIRIACRNKSGWPVVLSLWYLHEDGFLYCATQKSAKVIQYLENDPRCAFEIAEDSPPYCGVRGQAKARVDALLGSIILNKLLVRYLGGYDNDLARRLLKKSETEVAIVINPINIYTWNFSNRMSDIKPKLPLGKVCP